MNSKNDNPVKYKLAAGLTNGKVMINRTILIHPVHVTAVVFKEIVDFA